MTVLAFVLSILGQVLNTTASLVRGSRMKLILLLVFAANFSFATSYLLNDSGINGAASCYLGGILAIVNFWFTAKNRPFPKWLPRWALPRVSTPCWASPITPLSSGP